MKAHQYRSNIINLVDRLFVETGGAKSRLQKCENGITNAYLSSSEEGVPVKVQEYWQTLWEELNTEKEQRTKRGKLIQSSFMLTTQKKQSRYLQKFVLFFIEEFHRVI